MTAPKLILGLALLTAWPAVAQDASVMPEGRYVLQDGVDFYGADIQSLFDTTLEACQTACLADSECTAFTFNTRSAACFPKSGVTEEKPYAGAVSGRQIRTPEAALRRAEQRSGELDFLGDPDFDAAVTQAEGLSAFMPGGRDQAELLAAAAGMRIAGDLALAARFQAAAVNASDAADQWLDYSDILAGAADRNSGEADSYRAQALSAAVNAYLRADAAGLRATVLAALALRLEAVGRGRDMIPALRLAQEVQRRDDAEAMLDEAIGKYGFRIASHEVLNDSADPRICATFSEPLVRTGTDYAPFVKTAEAGLSVDAGEEQICIGGVTHGQRYAVTFRQGLPAASGEVLAKDISLTLYVRDRTPAVRFPGRAYVLPQTDQAGIPVETVNTDKLDLVLYRVSDRNLVRTMQADLFARPLDYWSGQSFGSEIAEEVWRGTGDVALEVNRDMTTRLPLAGFGLDLTAGIYALSASVPGQDGYDHPPAMQWFVVSDIGMTSFWGADGLHVFLRALSDGDAKAGVTVTLVSRANAPVGTAVTDAEGHAVFDAALLAGRGSAAPAMVTAEEGDDFVFLSLTEPEFDLSDRGVAGRGAAGAIDVFLSTDRGAYRAGETLHATILARDSAMRAIEGLPLTARLLRPDGVEYSRTVLADAGAGGHVAGFPLAATAPRGTWRIETFAEDDRVLAAQSFLVEDFLPERIDFTLTLDEGPMSLNDSVEIGIDARYLFGAPGAGLAIEGDLRLTAAGGLESYPGYRFGRYDEPFQPYLDTLGTDEATDTDGKATVYAAFPDLGTAATRPLQAEFAVRLKEGSGRPVERRVSREVLPGQPVIGIRPMFDDDAVPEGSEARFSVVSIGPDAAQVPMRVHWRLNRVETEYQWYSLYGQWNWEATTRRQRVAEGDLDLTAEGASEIAAKVDWGRYELVVEAAGADYTASAVEFHAGWYAPAGAVDTPDTLEIGLDKPAYRPGDTASVRIVPRAAGIALVSVLSNRLIDMKAVPVSAGENTIPLPVTDEWGAGAYVTVSVVKPMDAAAGRNPARALGLSYAPVDPADRRLSVAIEAPAEADPRGPLPVALKVAGMAPGETAFATIAAVDVGILNLTAFKAPDPEGYYFGQRRLGVSIRDLYGRLIDGQNGALGTVRSGGDAGSGLKMQSPPPTEELVAYFSGPLTVGPDGYARTDFALPAFNGTVRLMAVAWSKSAVGQAQSEVLVRDPVVVTASVPRFLAPGDESRVLLEIQHATGPAGRAGLDVTADGSAVTGAPSGVDLTDGGKVILSLPVMAGEADDTARVRIALTTPGGKLLEKTLTLPVVNNDPQIARRSRFDLAAGQTFTFDANVFAGLVPGTGRATLALGPIARFDAPGLLATLDRYPYGCTEQMTSRALPLLYFEDVAQAMGARGDSEIRTRIDQSIAAILLNQSSNGAFGLWNAGSGDLWLDAYVTDFLSRARTQGFDVPDAAFRTALDNLRNQINYAPDFDKDGGAYAYALMVLAREGAAAVGDLRYYADVKAGAFDSPIAAAQLAAALAAYGDQTRADAMFRRAGDMVAKRSGATEPPVWRADYGTDLRDATAVLALAAEAGSDAAGQAALEDRVAAGLAARHLSTQEASWALLAANALIDRSGAAGIEIDGAPATGPLVRMMTDAEAAQGAGQSVTNTGDAATTVTLTTFGVPSEPEPAAGNGYAITRVWYTLDGDPVDPAAVPHGARLVAVLEVTPYAGGEARLMVSDPLPAGFEIDNPALLRAGDIAALDWLDTVEDTARTEFRSDRFLAAVDWTSSDPFRLAYIVRAISPGRFHAPAASVEDMYRPDYRAQTDAGAVVVTD